MARNSHAILAIGACKRVALDARSFCFSKTTEDMAGRIYLSKALAE
jgi:hypothetical protein